MSESTRRKRMPLLEVVIAVLVVAMAVAILWPAMQRPKHSRHMQSNANLRSLAQSLYVAAQDNNGYFIGLDRDGQLADIDIEQRMHALVDAGMIDASRLLSPFERRDAWDGNEPFTSEHYSYALLQVPARGGRYDCWRDFAPITNRAAIGSDRNIGTRAEPVSVQSSGPWRGGIVYHDVSATMSSSHVISTDYGRGRVDDDHLFEAAGRDDAYMIHEGN